MKIIFFRFIAFAYTAFLLWMVFALLTFTSYLKKLGIFETTVSTICVVAFITASIFIWSKRKQLHLSTMIQLALIAALYALHYVGAQYPIEKIHLVSYTLLAMVYKLALSPDRIQAKYYLWAGFGCSLIGILDEGLQIPLPHRYFQWSDMYLNILAGILGLWLFWIFRPEPKTS